MPRSARILFLASIAAGVFEFALAPTMDVPAPAVVFGALFLAGALIFHRRGGTAAPVLLGLLFAVEIIGLPFYPRSSPLDWTVQLGFGLLSVVGLAAVIGVVSTRAQRQAVAS